MRTTFICGFPGETQEQFEKLENFIKEVKFDYAGFFAYSREEGTPADKLGGHLDEKVKEERARKLRSVQEKSSGITIKNLSEKQSRSSMTTSIMTNKCLSADANLKLRTSTT